MVALSDEQLKAKTAEFQQRYAKGETLDQLLPEAFAVVREAGKRVMGMRHFDVQLIGGMTLHDGKIAEMRTGEGKTLVGTLPVYLNALSGKGVHVVTVNDYLARRDANWMRPLYEFLGLSVGVVTPFQPPEDKRAAYAADITYGTNNEFGFDYLRDNMAFSLDDKFQRELNFAVVDEVDSILIDEARTPLIISGQAEDSSELYIKINKLIPRLKRQVEEVEGKPTEEGHYSIDEKTRQVELNEQGHQFIEDLLSQNGLLGEGESLYSAHNLSLLTHVYAALRAHPVPPQRRVHRPGRPDPPDRRAHRPHHAWPSPVRGLAPGHRGEGRPADPGREPDPGLHHLPELFPPVQQAGRHDRHRRYRGLRVPPDLRSRRGGDPDPPADRAQGLQRPGLPDPGREVRGDHHRHQAVPGPRPADPGRHRVDREFRVRFQAVARGRHRAQGAQRQVPREGSRDHRPGWRARFGDHRHQHGRPRYRHPPRRQLGSRSRGPGEPHRGADRPDQGRMAEAPPAGDRGGRPARDRLRAPRIPPDRQPVARPRRSSGRPGFQPLLPVAGRQPDADLRLRPGEELHEGAGHAVRRGDRAPHGDQRHREGPAQGRRAQLRHPQATAGIR